MTKTKKKGLTAEMCRENKDAVVTRWVLLDGKAYRYAKRHLPNAPSDTTKYVNLLRDLDGNAYAIHRVANMPHGTIKSVAHDVLIEGRAFEFHKCSGRYLGVLVTKKRGYIFVLVRNKDFDTGTKESN